MTSAHHANVHHMECRICQVQESLTYALRPAPSLRILNHCVGILEFVLKTTLRNLSTESALSEHEQSGILGKHALYKQDLGMHLVVERRQRSDWGRSALTWHPRAWLLQPSRMYERLKLHDNMRLPHGKSPISHFEHLHRDHDV